MSAPLPLIDDGLTGDEVFVGLADYGLFAEKLPPCFTSFGLSLYERKLPLNLASISDEKILTKALNATSHDYVRYEALRDTNVPRHLGIPHPESHLVQAQAIKLHWRLIKDHCERPNPQVSRIHVRHVGGGRIFEMNYKGRERFQFEEDEIGWMTGAQFRAHTDISACFHSIYTHSIPWALHGIMNAKKNRGLLALAGNLLDRCTQNLRDGQTNGILIGPHSSNILSELILTSVDEVMLQKGYKKHCRHIDDYVFYASSFAEAEQFLHDLGLELRKYEITLNEKKTEILHVPRPTSDNWKNELLRFSFPENREITFSTLRSFLDLALSQSALLGNSRPLNYAIKMIPSNLNARAKRLYVQEAINLSIAYPYLAPLLQDHVFARFDHEGMELKIKDFSEQLIRLGLKRIFPDAIAHGLFYALYYKIKLGLTEDELHEVLRIDDCLSSVLLFKYANGHKYLKVLSEVKKRATNLKSVERRNQDKQWLLIYTIWSAKELLGCNQSFLAELKKDKFEFLQFA